MKENMSQINISNYKQNVITAIILVILQSFIKKNQLQKPVYQKNLLYISKKFLFLLINYHLYYLYSIL